MRDRHGAQVHELRLLREEEAAAATLAQEAAAEEAAALRRARAADAQGASRAEERAEVRPLIAQNGHAALCLTLQQGQEHDACDSHLS